MPTHLLYYAAFAAFAALVWAVSSRAQRKHEKRDVIDAPGEVARTLGMTWVKGDPDFHLFADAPSRGMAAHFFSGTPLPYAGPATDFWRGGTLDGRMTELTFYAKLTLAFASAAWWAPRSKSFRQCRLPSRRERHADFESFYKSAARSQNRTRVSCGYPRSVRRPSHRTIEYHLLRRRPMSRVPSSRGLPVLDDKYYHVAGSTVAVPCRSRWAPLTFSPARRKSSCTSSTHSRVPSRDPRSGREPASPCLKIPASETCFTAATGRG